MRKREKERRGRSEEEVLPLCVFISTFLSENSEFNEEKKAVRSFNSNSFQILFRFTFNIYTHTRNSNTYHMDIIHEYELKLEIELKLEFKWC